MARIYDRTHDKENSYDPEPKHLGKTKTGVISENRKKLDYSLGLIDRDQPTTVQDSQVVPKNSEIQNTGSYSRRQNARRRGFDLKVSNIDSINDKITGLLNMVKKDRMAVEKKENTRVQREIPKYSREVNVSPHAGIQERLKRINGTNRPAGGETNRQIPTTSRFCDPYEHSRAPKQQDDSELPGTYKRKYLQEEDQKIYSYKPRQKTVVEPKERWQDTVQIQQRYTFKDKKSKYDIEDIGAVSEQKRAIDKMLQDRRKQRKQRQVQREKSSDLIHPKSRSAIKLRPEKTREITFNDEKRDSPISKVAAQCFESKVDEEFKKITTPISKKNQAGTYSRLVEVSQVQQINSKQEKIDNTARMIDQQLLRIKSRINESETNKTRLECFKMRQSKVSYKGKEHTIRIATSISAQVKLDSHLKQARQSFDKMPGESKWQELQKMCIAKGFNIQSRKLKQLVKIGPDEHNPFGGQKSSGSIEQLVQLLATAQKNWQNCVLHCSSIRGLKNQGFEVSDLDLNNKGYLGPEDIVCFVNLYANTFYRNRDLSLVMRRLFLLQNGSREGIQYDRFLEYFSS